MPVGIITEIVALKSIKCFTVGFISLDGVLDWAGQGLGQRTQDNRMWVEAGGVSTYMCSQADGEALRSKEVFVQRDTRLLSGYRVDWECF